MIIRITTMQRNQLGLSITLHVLMGNNEEGYQIPTLLNQDNPMRLKVYVGRTSCKS